MYEHLTEPLLPRHKFIGRMARNGAMGAGLLMFCLSIGIFGYHFIAGLAWDDALLDASMILSGMGPVATLQTTGAKIFASFYALFSGVMFISTMALLLAAPLHRLMHKLHLPVEENDAAKGTKHAKKESKMLCRKPSSYGGC